MAFMALAACVRCFSKKMGGNLRPRKTLTPELDKLVDLLVRPNGTDKLGQRLWGSCVTVGILACRRGRLGSRPTTSDSPGRARCY